MKNYNGFTLIEMLIAMSVVFMLVATAIPIDTLLKQERQVLQDRRQITLFLHDTLQEYLMLNNEIPLLNTVKINHRSVQIQIEFEDEWEKGCATWTNVRGREEELCLYGI